MSVSQQFEYMAPSPLEMESGLLAKAPYHGLFVDDVYEAAADNDVSEF